MNSGVKVLENPMAGVRGCSTGRASVSQSLYLICFMYIPFVLYYHMYHKYSSMDNGPFYDLFYNTQQGITSRAFLWEQLCSPFYYVNNIPVKGNISNLNASRGGQILYPVSISSHSSLEKGIPLDDLGHILSLKINQEGKTLILE